MNFLTFVNKEKGVVVVKASDAMEELYAEFYNFYCVDGAGYVPINIFREFRKKYDNMVNHISGIATCNLENGDVFDEEIGIMLAKERFMKTFEAYRAKMYEMIADAHVAMGAKAVRRLERSYDRKKDRFDRIDEIITQLREQA